MKQISWDEFAQVEIRVGTITRVEEFPEAQFPAWKIWADFGEEIGTLKSSARVTDLYTIDHLMNRQIIGVVNFPPKQVGPFRSEFLVGGFYLPGGEVVLAIPERQVPNGASLG